MEKDWTERALELIEEPIETQGSIEIQESIMILGKKIKVEKRREGEGHRHP